MTKPPWVADKPKPSLVAAKVEARLPTVRVLTRTMTLLEDTLEVLAHQVYLARKAIAADPNTPMSHEESETYNRHVRSMFLVLDAKKRISVDDRLSQITNEQLLELVPLAAAAIKKAGDK